MDNREFPHIVTVKSSAGAGKTYNLALRYLQLLTLGSAVGRPDLRSHICNIVAITFTNKAASEMRSRIIDWMKRIILDIPFKGSSIKPVDQIVSGPFDEKQRAEIMRSVEADFEDLIKNFYDFKVGTIDSFVNLTLKASAFKLGLPPDFEISTESALYVDAVVQEVLQEILENTDVRRTFDAFLRSYVEIEGENTAWVPKRFLTDTVYRFWKEEAKENKEFLVDGGLERVDGLRKGIAAASAALLAHLLKAEGLKPRKDFVNALTNLSAVDKTGFKGSACFRRKTIAQSLNKGSAEADGEAEEAWKDIRGLIALLVEGMAETKFSSYLEVYRLFKDRLRGEVTYRQRLILIEELNKLLQDVICGKHFIPEIYYALAERYSHFLIDEFQDTNHLQWKNIGVLADEALSRGGTLFLVGDKKQAIYRWRGGKAELVDEIAGSYPSYAMYPLCLDINYRSGEHVIAFNNEVFDTGNIMRLLASFAKPEIPAGWLRILETYQGSGQQCLDAKKGDGYVYVEKLCEDTEETESDETFSRETRNRLVAEKVEAMVKEIRARGIYEDRNVAVLVRRRQEAELIVKKLLEAGISVDSEFTVNVKNNPLIKEMIGLLQFLGTPHDDAALAGFLTGTIMKEVSPARRNEIIQWITVRRLHGGSTPLYRAFQRSHPVLWDEYFATFFKSAGYLPLYELFVLILKRWAILSRFPKDAPYFLHVCELIKKREGLGSNNLTGFLQFWRGGGGSAFGDEQEDETPFLLKTTEGANAVRVLTVHKAKGLQFPVVILPFLKLADFGASDRREKGKFFVADEVGLKLLQIKREYIDYSPKLRDIYLEKETEYLIDEINSAYVACTRAEKELYIILADSKRQKNYFIDYLFVLEKLKPFARGSILEMGRKKEYDGTRPSLRESPAPSPWEAPRFGETGQLRWLEKVRGKFEPSESCSREQVSAKKKGDVIHFILSLIPYFPEGDDTVLNNAIRQGVLRFGLSSHEKEIRDMMTRFFSYGPFRSFFLPGNGSTVYTEKEIVDKRGEAYKADRIVIREDRVDVIDFKTGETRSKEHVEQIRNYGRLLEQIHKDRPVAKHLLYIDENRLETL